MSRWRAALALSLAGGMLFAPGSARAFAPTTLAQYPIPVVLDQGYLRGTCLVDTAVAGDTCAFWYTPDGTGSPNFAFANLDLWNVPRDSACANASSSDRSAWIALGYPDPLGLRGDPPGSRPTFVCDDTGHSAADRNDLAAQIGTVKYFPVNDCARQVDAAGDPAPCPQTPDKLAVTGFEPLEITHVYKGDDPAAIGTPGGPPGACGIHPADPNAICLVLTVVDVRPDASIALTKDGPFRGDGVYDDTGVGQRRSRTIAAGHVGRFFIDLGNDASFLDSFIVSGSGSSGPFEARYVVATTPVGPQVTGEGLSLSFVPAGDARLLRLSVSVADDAAAGRRRTWTITLTSAVDPAAVDVVRARVTTA